ncbi:hypothetical protein AC579_7706 [Pseudocercospora musae]|uniref:Uncharacterized protein n=1 Tax=Pseudocercospora musae TaxID=113226 RepID=A0A139ITR3_9PEZI|nr:hypothetical protein AC579_7706 [Pseudocercospora musae]
MSISSVTTSLSRSSHLSQIPIRRPQCRAKGLFYSTHSDKPAPEHEAIRRHVNKRTKGIKDWSDLRTDGQTEGPKLRVAPSSHVQQFRKSEAYHRANYGGFSEECQRSQHAITSGKIDVVESLRTILPAEPSPASRRREKENIVTSALKAEIHALAWLRCCDYAASLGS